MSVDPGRQFRPGITHGCKAPKGERQKGIDAADLMHCWARLLKIGGMKRLRGAAQPVPFQPPPGFGNSQLVFSHEGTAPTPAERRVFGVTQVLVPGLIYEDQ